MNRHRFNKVNAFSGETSGIVKKTYLITVALLSCLFLAAIISLFFIADNLNNKADARSSMLLQKALTNRQEKIRSNLMDNAEWGEAYNHLHKQINLKWRGTVKTSASRFTPITTMKARLSSHQPAKPVTA